MEWLRGTPVNCSKATGTLTISGVVNDGQTVTIRNNVYEFDANASVGANRIAVDISGGTKTQATKTLTISGTVKDGETFTIGEEVYEFDSDGVVGAGHIAVDISGNTVAGTGTLTFTGVVADGETVTIDDMVFEYDTDGVVAAGHLRVDVSIAQTAAAAVTALVVAINLHNVKVTAADGAGDTVVVTAKTKGTIGNYAISTTCQNASWGGPNMASGADCSAANAVTAAVTKFESDTAYDITATDGAGDTVVFTADAAGDQDGSAGNAIAVAETMANGSFGAGGFLAGGTDCTAAEAVTALVTKITSDDDYVDAADGAGDTVVVTSKLAGTDGNGYGTSETMANGSWGHDHLQGGDWGTIGTPDQVYYDDSYVYVTPTASIAGDTHWKRCAISTF